MSLTVVFREAALRTLARVRSEDKEAFVRIRRAIAALADQPHPDGAIAWGGTGIFRLHATAQVCREIERPVVRVRTWRSQVIIAVLFGCKNQEPVCRHDHQRKQTPGCTLTTTVPGTLTWTSPGTHPHHHPRQIPGMTSGGLVSVRMNPQRRPVALSSR